MELVEEAQPAGKEGEATTEPVVAPATETVAAAPGEATEDKPEIVVEAQREKQEEVNKEGGEEGETKKEEGESKVTEGDGDGKKDETATVTVEVERPGSKLSRIEEEPEIETTPG